MTAASAFIKPATETTILCKADPTTPALKLVGKKLYIKASTVITGVAAFDQDALVRLPRGGMVAGTDYAITLSAGGLGVEPLTDVDVRYFAGFHFAPGGNAVGNSGGDAVPQINPASFWDLNYRPNGVDPRGKHIEELDGVKYWLGTYFLGRDHMTNGTSKFGVTIADGRDPPQNPKGGYYERCDYATVGAALAYHGETLATVAELRNAAQGVTECSSAKTDPMITGLDQARTGRNGGQQMTGNLWTWCVSDPDEPRASIFGGSWLNGDYAGSRCANVGHWAGRSGEFLGVRGRSDHLQLG